MIPRPLTRAIFGKKKYNELAKKYDDMKAENERLKKTNAEYEANKKLVAELSQDKRDYQKANVEFISNVHNQLLQLETYKTSFNEDIDGTSEEEGGDVAKKIVYRR